MVEKSLFASDQSPRRIRRKLLVWYRRHRRDLPWRRTGDPYRIWVAEVMLQQTQVATVIPYYERFVRRFPTVAALAKASPDAVLSLWSGLGYYRRARNLHAAAKELARLHGGKLPADPTLLRRLPGVGSYTAGAVASIAFGLPEPALDGNTLRVLSRLLAWRGNPKSGARLRAFDRLAREIVRGKSPGEITQALMELGALVCLPATPRCEHCPVRTECVAFEKGLQSALPETGTTRLSRDFEAAVAILVRKGSFLMVRRQGEGLMEGLWEFPGGILDEGESPREGLARIGRERLGEALTPLERLAIVRQTITYRRVKIGAYRAVLSEPGLRKRWSREVVRWVSPDEIHSLPHGSATRRILAELEPPSVGGNSGGGPRRRRSA
ncbi:MAG TPA: A/G-specific adenine glycosylase [Candidatus Polarisedimenticolia bacterium]|nr:A/G-specific adenine glycosylase [Candidatus Polarisedimenticolia bacterium]